MRVLDPPLDRAVLLVTGGGGFIGSHLVRHLLSAGVRRVTVLDRSSVRPADSRTAFVPFTLGIDDPQKLRSHLRGVDYVFHLAAIKHNEPHIAAGELLAANVNGTYALLEAAAQEGVKRVVFASSVYTYHRVTGPPLVETEFCRPTTVYGISKLAGELLIDHFRRHAGLDGASLRYFFVFGPGQRGRGGHDPIVPHTLRRLCRGERPVVFGDGAQVLDYVYVDDVCRATLAAVAPEASGAVLNVGSGRAIPIRELVETMMEVAGRRLTIEGALADATASTSRVADLTRIGQVLGWSPEVPLLEGLRQTLRWIEQEP